jgi:hypothetical protein
LASIPLLCVFYLGLVPAMSSIAFDYTRPIPLSEAVAGVLKIPPWRLLRDPYTAVGVFFIPLGIGALTVFVLTQRPRVKLIVAAVAIGLPIFCGHLLGCIFGPMLLVTVVPSALLGRSDGEDWSEGMVAYGAAGGWVVLWCAILVTIFVKRRRYAVK